MRFARSAVVSPYKLAPSAVYSILRDSVLDAWLPIVQTIVPAAGDAVGAGWSQTAYSKGMVGHMVDAAFVASHAAESAGLTTAICADMCQAVMRTLLTQLRFANVHVTHADSQRLIDALIVGSFLPRLVELWSETGKNGERLTASGMSSVLPARFAAEEAAEAARLAAIKARGVDARFEGASASAPRIDERAMEFQMCLNKVKQQLRRH